VNWFTLQRFTLQGRTFSFTAASRLFAGSIDGVFGANSGRGNGHGNIDANDPKATSSTDPCGFERSAKAPNDHLKAAESA
jgi:hypothetical protein